MQQEEHETPHAHRLLNVVEHNASWIIVVDLLNAVVIIVIVIIIVAVGALVVVVVVIDFGHNVVEIVSNLIYQVTEQVRYACLDKWIL